MAALERTRLRPICVLLVLAATCTPGVAVAASHGKAKMRATITRTKYGVPHIVSRGLARAGLRLRLRFAEDNICTIADSYVTVDAQRSRYFGPDGSWTFSGNGSVNNNLDSDFFYQRIDRRGLEHLLDAQGIESPSKDAKAAIRGYAAGYNAYLKKVGVDNIPTPLPRRRLGQADQGDRRLAALPPARQPGELRRGDRGDRGRGAGSPRRRSPPPTGSRRAPWTGSTACCPVDAAAGRAAME